MIERPYIYTSTFQKDGFRQPTFDVDSFALVSMSPKDREHKAFKWHGVKAGTTEHTYFRIAEGAYKEFYQEILKILNVPGRIHTHYNINKATGVVFSIHFIPHGVYTQGKTEGSLDNIDDFCDKLVALDVMES